MGVRGRRKEPTPKSIKWSEIFKKGIAKYGLGRNQKVELECRKPEGRKGKTNLIPENVVY